VRFAATGFAGQDQRPTLGDEIGRQRGAEHLETQRRLIGEIEIVDRLQKRKVRASRQPRESSLLAMGNLLSRQQGQEISIGPPLPLGAINQTAPDATGIVGNHVRRTACAAGVPGNGAHRLRHTFCSHLAMRGAPARAIQELAGHQDLITTQLYMHLSPAAVEGAIRLLELPNPTTGRGEMFETTEQGFDKSLL
jgi:integrase